MDTAPQTARPMDPGRIHRLDPGDMDLWTRELGCTVEELQAVIDEVGDHPAAVREALARRHGATPRSR